MGFGGVAAGVGAAAALAGTGISYSASQHSAAAAAQAQQQELQQQNQAFQARNLAQQQQTQEQAAAQNRGQAAYLEAQQKMRSGQQQALQDQQTQIAKMNEQEAAIQQQTQQQVQQTTQQAVTPASLQEAQAASAAARMAPVQQTAADIGASNPLPSSGQGSATKSALAKAMSDAADYTRGYGQRLATLGSYSAPLTTADLAASNLKTQLLPEAAADQLLKAGVNARLLPSQTAYSGATNLGRAAIDANTMDTNERMQLASTRRQYTEDIANLGQQDMNAAIQTGLNVTQARDAATASLGKGISSIGNAAIGLGASQGAFSNLFGASGPFASTAGYISGATGSNLGGAFAPAIGTETMTPYWSGLMRGAAA